MRSSSWTKSSIYYFAGKKKLFQTEMFLYKECSVEHLDEVSLDAIPCASGFLYILLSLPKFIGQNFILDQL